MSPENAFKIDCNRVQQILCNPVGTTAGHASVFKYSEDKIMKFSNSYEVQVYQAISKFPELKSIVPTYYGFVDIPQNQVGDHFICRRVYKPDSTRVGKDHAIFIILENLLLPFSIANVADIKLGLRNYEVGEDERKERVERDHSTGSDIYGGRFDGISSHKQIGLHKLELWSHSFCENLLHYLTPEFVYGNHVNLSAERKLRLTTICNMFIEKLTKIYEIMEKCADNFNFLQSSILLIYEADESKEPLADARLIDFDLTRYKVNDDSPIIVPHVKDQTILIGDVGAARGPRSLVKELNELLKIFV